MTSIELAESTLQHFHALILIDRVGSAMKKIQDLPQTFDLKQLDNELASMALIKALPKGYSAFTFILLLVKDDLDEAKIHQAFVIEDTQCHCHANDSATVIVMSANALAKTSYDFCNWQGHIQANCCKYKAAQQQAKQQTKSYSKGKKGQQQANTASIEDKSKKDDGEFAGNA
ncbi:hypothetical protein C0995_004951, partial [Termitomyces sp. Mi166